MFCGTIIRSEGIASKLGFPTANLDCKRGDVHWDSGVYAAVAELEGKTYQGALVIIDSPEKIEVHLLNYAGPDVYGKELKVDPVQKVSEIEKYDDEAELLRKIESDIKAVREILDKA